MSNLGSSVTLKMVSSDIALLIEFELPEIKLLVDAIESSKLVTHKKIKVLISKLSKLVSKEKSKELERKRKIIGTLTIA